jgi:hypothetical protein
MISKQHSLVAVMPVYEDLEASSRLFRELAQEYRADVFVIAVDDGSVRQPLPLTALSDAGVAGVIVKLRRNVGHQRAIAVGLGFASEHLHPHQVVVVMDSDGEDTPASIRSLLETIEREAVDVVVAQRRSRVETLRFKAFYVIYKWFFGLMTGRAISFGNFMVLRAPSVARLVAMQETAIHVAGSVLASKLRIVVYPIDRGPRYAGQSKMNLVGLILHGFKALMVFAEDVLVRVGLACAITAVGCVLGVALATVLKFLGYSTPGWFSIALGVLVLMFLQTGALALMTLMLTGVMRGGTVSAKSEYTTFIAEVLGPSLGSAKMVRSPARPDGW